MFASSSLRIKSNLLNDFIDLHKRYFVADNHNLVALDSAALVAFHSQDMAVDTALVVVVVVVDKNTLVVVVVPWVVVA